MLKEMTEVLTKTVTTLDEEMQKEIGRVVQVMAEHLGGVTQKFVEDYTPLLEHSRRIVEMAENAKI